MMIVERMTDTTTDVNDMMTDPAPKIDPETSTDDGTTSLDEMSLDERNRDAKKSHHERAEKSEKCEW
jgi:hypothetical protein